MADTSATIVLTNISGEQIQVRIDKGGTPAEVGAALRVALARYNPQQNMGYCGAPRFAAYIISYLHADMGHNVLVNSAAPSHYRYMVPVSNNSISKITCMEHGREVFCGSLADLQNFADPFREVKKHIGKIVRFSYEGGSRPGRRIIRLESVGSDCLKGVDVTKEDEGEAFRQYKLDKISGEIEVLS